MSAQSVPASIPYCSHTHTEPLAGAAALTAHGVSVGYPSTAGLALSDINLRVPVGARIALVGPNGAGKSTLLKAAVGLLPLRAGDLRIFGLPLGACHHRVVYLPQRSDLDWRFPLTVRRLVLTGRYVHLGWLRRPGRRDHELVEAALARLGLTDLAERQIGQLSGGQQQRLLLARALAQEADLFLLDEPLNAIDAEARAIVSSVLADIKAQGKTALVATHDLGRLDTDFDGALYLSGGRAIEAPPGAFVGLHLHAEGAWAG